MKKISLLFSALLFFEGLCDAQTSIRIIDLDEYPAQSVEFKDLGISFQRISQEQKSDTLWIDKNINSIFHVEYVIKALGSEMEMESDEYYGTISILQGQTILLKTDSIAMVGPIDYSAHYDKIVVPLVLYQSQDNLDTAIDLYLIDLQSRVSRKINEEPVFNSEYGCITKDGKFVIYGSFGKLYKYDIETGISQCVIDFDNPTLFIFKLTYENNALTIYSYNNYIEDALFPIQKRMIPNIVI